MTVPNMIGNAKTLFIAETDGIFDLIERDGQKIEIPFISVCQYDPAEGYYLFGCDKDFNTHTDFYYDKLEEALDDAKRIYDLKHINWRQWLPTMNFADTEEIYVSIIDGVQVWVPIRVKLLDNNQFLILNNNEFDCTDYSLLPEYVPGDTVSIGQKKFEDEDLKRVAVALIKPSPHPDKNFFEFLYHATLGDLSADKITLRKYKSEIGRVKIEFSKGKYFYPTILETIDRLDKIETTR